MTEVITKCNTKSLHQTVTEKYPQIKYSVSDDFIGLYDGLFSKEYCDKWIKRFEEANANGLSYNRLQGFDRPSHIGADQSIDYVASSFFCNHDMKFECGEFVEAFWTACYPLYAEKFSILSSCEMHKIYTVKIQRTLPKEGYHAWHCENQSRVHSDRVLTFIMYLNDIDDGGETEFLYLSKRVKPVAGRVLLWPAGFTHTHRGNPPLENAKYIITGWLEF